MNIKKKRKESIFKKYLALSMTAVFVGLSVLGVMIVFFVTQYWQADRWETLESYATTMSLSITDKIIIENDKAMISDTNGTIKETMQTLSGGLLTDIIIVDSEGKIAFFSENAKGITKNTVIKNEYFEKAVAGGLNEISDFGGIYDDKYYIVGVPVQYLQNGELIPVGAVFVTTSSQIYRDYVTTIIKIFCSAGIVIFALIFCFMGLFAYQITKPLGQMAKAADAFGKGNFSERVYVTSNDEIGRLAVSFNTMADSLDASEGMRRTFITNVSHELKTPMTTIIGFVDGILDGTFPEEKQMHYLRIVSSEVKRLSRLVTSMLALSRIDSGELKLVGKNFDITSTLFNIFFSFEQQLNDRNINVLGLDELEPIEVYGDADMIHQAIYNLVENASKFTNEGGDISVKAKTTKDELEIAITNTGDGIPPEQIGFIFERFYKTDESRSYDKKGLGLGLYLVRSILRQHGGDITAESKVGEYTTFRFTLPLPSKR